VGISGPCGASTDSGCVGADGRRGYRDPCRIAPRWQEMRLRRRDNIDRPIATIPIIWMMLPMSVHMEEPSAVRSAVRMSGKGEQPQEWRLRNGARIALNNVHCNHDAIDDQQTQPVERPESWNLR